MKKMTKNRWKTLSFTGWSVGIPISCNTNLRTYPAKDQTFIQTHEAGLSKKAVHEMLQPEENLIGKNTYSLLMAEHTCGFNQEK
jgi:hypothetical protein